MASQAPPELYRLIEANGRMWAGEAEIFGSYFRSNSRTAQSDSIWLARQCYKELIDGVANRLNTLTLQHLDDLDVASNASMALSDEGVVAELRHYVAFAAAYRLSLTECGNAADIHGGRIGADWPENAALQAHRAEHIRRYGNLGKRAQAFTEGGYCTLYSTGMALAIGSPLDQAIANACGEVMDDEWEHMLEGIAGLAQAPLAPADWEVLETLTVEQGRLRIRMRNAQFGHPLPEARVRELEAGAAAPLPFDFARAGLALP